MQISRRSIVKGIAGGLPLATVLADPMLARAVAAGLETVTLTTTGGRNVSAALALPEQTPAHAVLLIHEWWGLNDQIKAVAAELAKDGYVALAVDLYDGKVASTTDEAKAMMGGVDGKAATDTLTSWVAWLKKSPKGNGKVATIGWCFGGGWSLNASLATPVDATVIYYGNVKKTAAELEPLKSPVLMHYGLLDKFINTEMVKGFEAEAEKAHKHVTVYAYDANHAFANPTGAAYPYVKEAAELAWTRTLAFLKEHD
ncbi:MAG: dienelactone hydrolase family protein [Alphaproteobacteria bacterium]